MKNSIFIANYSNFSQIQITSIHYSNNFFDYFIPSKVVTLDYEYMACTVITWLADNLPGTASEYFRHLLLSLDESKVFHSVAFTRQWFGKHLRANTIAMENFSSIFFGVKIKP